MTEFDEIRQRMELMSDEELLTIIQEHDEEQWRPEVFDIVRTILTARGVSPDDNAGSEMPEEPPELDLVTLATYSTDADAEMDRLALASRGINAWVVDNGPSMAIPAGVVLKVLESDLHVAEKLLDPQTLKQPVPSSDLPDEIAEPPCPKCGSRDVMESAEIVYDPDPRQEWMYSCSSCGHKWSEQ